MPSRVNWPVMGGPTAHPTRVTLALGNPSSSLNAPGGSLGCFLVQEARETVLLVVHERSLGLAHATSVATESERDSDRRIGLPHRRGSSAEASCLVVGVEVENTGPLPCNRDITDGQVGKEAAVQ